MNLPQLRGRPPLIATPLSAFTVGINGNPPIVPFKNEMCYDDLGDGSDGRIVFSPDGTSWHFQSTTQDLNNYIKQLEYSGIFINAAAGMLSHDLTYFFFNPLTKVVVLNTDLVYPIEYKYYAIRSGIDYITGRIDTIVGSPTNGKVITNLVDMKITQPNGTTPGFSKPESGMLLPTKVPVDGSTYVVEFFDETKTIVDRDTFYATAVKQISNDIPGNVGITDIVVAMSRVMSNVADSTHLYVGEDANQIAFNIYLVYADGTTRNVTYEIATGRLSINGVSRIDTSVATTGAPQTFDVTYYALNSDGTVNTTPAGSANDIHKTIKVFILYYYVLE